MSSVDFNETKEEVKSKDEDVSVDEDQSKDEVEDTSVAPENFFHRKQVVLVCRTKDEDVGIEIICRV